MPVPHLTAPCAQQARIDIVPRRNSPHRRTRLMGLGDDPQLFFHAPAPAAFPPVDNLDRAIRHDFKVDLRSAVSPHPARTQQGGDHRTVTLKGKTMLIHPLAERLRGLGMAAMADAFL